MFSSKYRIFGLIVIIALMLSGVDGVGAQTTNPEPAAPVAAAAPAPASPEPLKVGDVTLSGSLRLRYESWGWFESETANSSYGFGAVLLRVGAGQQKERFDWLIEGAFPLLVRLPSDAIALQPQGQLGLGASYYAANGERDGSAILKQAFVRIKGLGSDKPSSLRIGRFEFIDGAERAPSDPSLALLKRDRIAHRLIGPFTFTHVGRSFDGVHYARGTGKDNITFVAARPTEGVFQLRSWHELDIDFYYGAYTRAVKTEKTESDARVFALHYHDGRRVLKTDNRPLALRQADLDKIRVTTLGGHYLGIYKTPAGKLDLLAWGAGQFGNWGNLDHRAGAIAAEIGHQFTGGAADRIKPWLRAGYFRSTGDPDPLDGVHNTFFQNLPTPRVYARFPFYNLMNNEDIFAELRFKPHPRVSLRGDIRYLRLSSAGDQWYLGGGAFQQGTFGYIARPSLGKKKLGTLFDLSVDLNLTSTTALTFYLAGVSGGNLPAAIYPDGRNARYAYLELTQRF